MKKRLFFCLSLAFIVCFGLYIKTHAFTVIVVPPELWQLDHSKMQGGLEASAPRILSTPMDGSVFHGERNVTPGYGQVVSEVWTPTKPWDYYEVRIGVNAEGLCAFVAKTDDSTRDAKSRSVSATRDRRHAVSMVFTSDVMRAMSR